MNTTASAEKPSILLTFDVEDWFQVENLKGVVPGFAWNRFALRVERNTQKLLDLLDGFPFRPRATFFVLGWVAMRLPGMVREIFRRGHEVASHGYGHALCSGLTVRELTEDLAKGRAVLEDITGRRVWGYRAPSFSADDRVLARVRDAGYIYDASVNGFSAHGRYGKVSLSGMARVGGVFFGQGRPIVVPVSNLKIGAFTLPLGGGGYFRLFPGPLFRSGVKKVVKTDRCFVFYAHPWELDPDQPRVKGLSRGFEFRHYVNLDKTETRLARLIRTFGSCRFPTIAHYLESLCQHPSP